MAGSPLPQSDNVQSNSTSTPKFALSVMTSIFFIWGFITCLNDILIPHLRMQFDLSYTQAMLIQFCFFGAYFICSIPAGRIVGRIGYKKGMVTGLLITAVGAGLFYPAAATAQYVFFLAALFVLASGITLLQVAANPYVVALGPSSTAETRLNLTQAFNSLGTTIAPLFGGLLIFGLAANATAEAHAEAVQIPYIGIAAFLILLAVIVSKTSLPVIASQEKPVKPLSFAQLKQYPHLLFGVLGIFLYVGGEVAIGSFLVNFLGESHIGGMSEETASAYVAYYWGGAMVGRFVGSYVMLRVSAHKVLTGNAVIAMVLIITAMMTSGQVAVWAILLVGLFNSIMFPTIFSLSLKGMGQHTSQASGLLCLAIVGGALVPLLQGVMADGMGVQLAFIVPVFCYLYIAWFASVGSKQQKHAPDAELAAS